MRVQDPGVMRKQKLKKTKKRKKKSELSKLKERLESLQKQVVIKKWGRDCFTCDKTNLHGINCQLGHVPWPRVQLSVKAIFDIRYTRIQCSYCNNPYWGLAGAGATAALRMQKEGIDVDALWAESKAEKGKAVTKDWFQLKINEYESLL